MWDEFGTQPDLTGRYRLCGIGLTLAAVACCVITFDSAAQLSWIFTRDRRLVQFVQSQQWVWLAGTALSWSALAGSLMMIGRWDEPGWRRRSLLLSLLAFGGVVFWAARNASRFGFDPGPAGFQLFRDHLAQGIRWLWMLVLIDIAGDVGEHLGLVRVVEERALARTSIYVAIVFWVLFVLMELPLLLGQPGGMAIRMRMVLPLLGFIMARCVSSFLTAILLLTAARECSKVLKELEAHRLEGDF